MTEVKHLSSVCAFSGHEVHENNYGDIEVDYHIYALIIQCRMNRPYISVNTPVSQNCK